MDIEIIREFVEFSKTLNFSKTARAINISQSAFSSHILKLEKDLDAKLIDRGQSNVLTGEGKLFLEYATSIVGSYDDVKSKLKQLHSGNQNVVRVHKAIFLAKPCDYFNRELYAFSKAHPDIVVRHVADDLNPTTRMLKDGCIDFGFIAIDCFDVVEGREGFDYEYFPFAREELVVWAPTNGLFANIESVHLQQLNGCVAVSKTAHLSTTRQRRASSSQSITISTSNSLLKAASPTRNSIFRNSRRTKSFWASNPALKATAHAASAMT